ncbi:conserved protein of unknown function [Xenorhabdus doucetiae]|uniref:Uncharacterized protein n=1 Tax=Xenorhabdus doucetiae TaxID=351671 RepID=A0A068QTI0_9GAMM|nr:conserved protein of unknown function [Xenorhabdus doucetiae]
MFPVSTGINRNGNGGGGDMECVPREYGDKPGMSATTARVWLCSP